MSRREDHAIVVGGSIAGLLAARALTQRFAKVTLVDRDRFPERAEYRKGVPQSAHAHALLARGQALLEEMFPGLIGELLEHGAVPLIVPRDVLAHTAMGWASRSSESGLSVLSCSRELIEFHVRRRVSGLSGITFIQNTDVEGLVPSEDSAAILGIRMRRRGVEGSVSVLEELSGDLVVDASGRDSRTAEWLGRLGYSPPEETRVVSRAGYASRYYAPPDGFTADWKMLFLFPFPASPRGGVLFPIEGGRWLVTLIGMAGDYPPTDEEGFLDFARSLPGSVLYDVIRRARPLSSPRGYRRTENVRRNYERLSRWPDGLVVTGDAVCTFNPIYGQGMSVCALEAAGLRESIAARAQQPARNVAKQLQGRLARISTVPWLLATSADLRYPTTEGPRRNRLSGLVSRYVDRLQTVSMDDQVVASAFRQVSQLLKPPTSLFAPNIAIRVLAPRRIRRRDVAPMQMSFGATTPGSADAPQATP